MKNSLLICLFLLFSMYLKAIEPIKITVTISDTLLSKESQWVYWFTLIGSEYNIEDSCFLAKGQKTFRMEKTFSNKGENAMSWLTFSKSGPSQAIFFPAPGEDIKLYISPKDFLYIKGVEGSPETSEGYHNSEEWGKSGRKLYLLKDSLLRETDSIAIQELSDSIDFYEEYHNKRYWRIVFDRSKTPGNILSAFSMLRSIVSSKEEYDSLYLEMKQRFPESRRIQEYYVRTPPATSRSKKMLARFKEIGSDRYRKPTSSEIPRINIQPPNYEKELSKIKTLVSGDIVEDLVLKGLDEIDISLETITTPYVLIDFWASWCAPCRWEFPKLKKIHSSYKDILTVYAISVDNNESSWRNAIEAEKIEEFVHVYVGNFGALETKKLCKRFGVTGIPANFLLNKNREIIAVNLRGEELEKKLMELTIE